VTEGPGFREGKPYVVRIGDDNKFSPTLYAYESNGNISRYLSRWDEWTTMRFGTKNSSSYRDSSTRAAGGWTIRSSSWLYRDTVLDIDGQLYSGVKEERSVTYRYVAVDGSAIDSLSESYLEYDVWIPSTGYYGLIVSDPGTPNEYIARLSSYSLGAVLLK